jgi:hypothetical protein
MGYIQRIWTANTTLITAKTGTLQVWDSGDVRFERWPDGSETSWKVISRKKTADGFIETLEPLDLWVVPVKPVWKESLPVNLYREGFSVPGWDVKIIV